MATFTPAGRLSSRVVAIDVVESAGGEQRVLPSTSVVLGVQYRGRVRGSEGLLSMAGVTGILASARTFGYAEPTGSVLVRFTPQGAACLGVPMAELTDRSVALDDLMPRARVAELTERLEAAGGATERVALMQAFLLALPYARDAAVGRAVTALSAVDGAPSIAALATALGLSERQLERRFLARVGLTPKRFARLARFERAAAALREAPSLSAAAQAAGYYDQSHFVRDVREFAGVPPSALRQAR